MTTVTAALVCLTAASTGQAVADKVGTVPEDQAAKQLRLGLTDSQDGPWAKTKLATLEVKPDGPMDGYSRDLFPHWEDASDNGWPAEPHDSCNARNAALFRDGEGVTSSDSCTSLKGTWVDPYSAKVFDATGDIDIDHVVPLANAYRAGADKWTKDVATKYANDPLVLVSSWDRLNQQKGDKGPEAWKPPNQASHCDYAIRWVTVKAKYDLRVNSAEKSTLTTMLGTCPA